MWSVQKPIGIPTALQVSEIMPLGKLRPVPSSPPYPLMHSAALLLPIVLLSSTLYLIPAMITNQAWCPPCAFLHEYNCCKKSSDLLTIGWSAFVKERETFIAVYKLVTIIRYLHLCNNGTMYSCWSLKAQTWQRLHIFETVGASSLPSGITCSRGWWRHRGKIWQRRLW